MNTFINYYQDLAKKSALSVKVLYKKSGIKQAFDGLIISENPRMSKSADKYVKFLSIVHHEDMYLVEKKCYNDKLCMLNHQLICFNKGTKYDISIRELLNISDLMYRDSKEITPISGELFLGFPDLYEENELCLTRTRHIMSER